MLYSTGHRLKKSGSFLKKEPKNFYKFGFGLSG